MVYSDNARLQMAPIKLTSNDEEHRKLQQNYISQETIHELKNTELIISGEKFALKIMRIIVNDTSYSTHFQAAIIFV